MKLTPYQSRYGMPIDEPQIETNEFITGILQHSSCKRFNNRPLSDGMLELLIGAAQSASTSGMLQTWSVIALTTTEDKAKLFNAPDNRIIIGDKDSQNYIAIDTSSVVLLWLADLSRVNDILKNEPDDQLKAQTTRAEYHLKAVIDATIAAQTCFIAAEAMGLSGTYCGAIRQLPIEFLEKEFNLPKYTFPIFGTVLGYALHKPNFVKPRLPLDVVLHHGSYKQADDTALKEYDKILSTRTHSSYKKRVVERMVPSETKSWVGNSLRHMGFNFK
jgi:nitroreductase